MSKKIKVTLLDKNTIRIDENAEKGDLIDLSSITNIDINQLERIISEGKDEVYARRLKEELKKQEELFNEKQENKIKVLLLEKEKELQAIHNKEIENERNKYKVLENSYNVLLYKKSYMKNKETGNELEVYCSSAVNNLMQIGFDNCSYYPDNKSVKSKGESKGTKGDAIFKIFMDEKHEGEPLASICIEIKNESVEPGSKKKNSSHYAKLNEDRIKKNCKYALLVSTLESENDEILPIQRIHEYPDMYMVRPAYLTTFLTIITSLTMKFKDIIVADKNNKLLLEEKAKFLLEFENFKQKYLDNPLKSLKTKIDVIKESAQSINKTCDEIIDNYIDDMKDNIDTLQSKIVKSYDKMNS